MLQSAMSVCYHICNGEPKVVVLSSMISLVCWIGCSFAVNSIHGRTCKISGTLDHDWEWGSGTKYINIICCWFCMKGKRGCWLHFMVNQIISTSHFLIVLYHSRMKQCLRLTGQMKKRQHKSDDAFKWHWRRLLPGGCSSGFPDNAGVMD